MVEILLLPGINNKWVKGKLIKNIGKSSQGEQLWTVDVKTLDSVSHLRVRESKIRPLIETTEKHSEKVGSTGGRRKKKRTRKKKKKRRRKRKTRKKRRKTKKKRR
jgi:hypothetical protein